MPTPQNIALFGGTFDPIHDGHLALSQKAVEEFQLDQVIFIPCRRSPHKENAPSVSDLDRLEMLNIASSNLSWATVDDYELKKPPPSFTWETVKHFKNELEGEPRFFLLIGMDQWLSLPEWKNIKILAQDLEFIVVGRNGQPAKPREGYSAHFIEGNHPASATKIREQLKKHQSSKWLDEKVLHYISKKGLYS